MKKTFLILIIILLFSLTFAFCSNGNSQEEQNNTNLNNTKDADTDNIVLASSGSDFDIEKADEIVSRECIDCHGMEIIDKAFYDKQGWEKIVDLMINKGATLNDDEKSIVVNYLYYKDGEQLVQDRCIDCHSMKKIDKASYSTEEEWAKVVSNMINKGTKLNDEEKQVVIDHLVIYSSE